MKRAIDVLFSLIAIVLLAPLLLVVALLVRIKLGSPVLFSQDRPGLHGQVFRMYKFRTMIDARDPDGNPWPDSRRLTPFGEFLRAASLDELPELWNVLRGDMSIVGPRPLLKDYLPLYSREQSRRHDVKPGITGWAQVNGRNTLDWEKKFELDVWYVDHHSIALDLRIILATTMKVIRRDGISGEGHATMAKFEGSREKSNAAHLGGDRK